ncbi:MAG TPA: hypothetical protein VHT03_11900 [Rhizomicrobium sp.]|jgi:hypothetical protein|nr:hypothetical protein [Rhizomicrobium sp.]
MVREKIREDFEVYVHDGEVAFGAVRQVAPGGRAEIVVYVENAGDFTVPLSAVRDVHDEKVIVDCASLDRKLREAIGHAHLGEDPNIADKPDEPPVD